MSYTVLHEAGAPHICDLPATREYYPGTVIECNDCGVSYVLGEDRGAPSWIRRPKPSAARPSEERSHGRGEQACGETPPGVKR